MIGNQLSQVDLSLKSTNYWFDYQFTIHTFLILKVANKDGKVLIVGFGIEYWLRQYSTHFLYTTMGYIYGKYLVFQRSLCMKQLPTKYIKKLYIII